MVQIDWGGYQNALARIPNPGEAFQAGIQSGRAQRKEQQYDAALKGFAANPDNPLAQNALLPFNPELAIRAQQMSQERKRYAEQAPSRELEQKVKKLEFAKKANETAIELLDVVEVNPAAWPEAKAQYSQMLMEFGLPVPPLPDTITPEGLQQLRLQTLSTKERLDHELKTNKIDWVTIPGVGAFSINAQGIPVAPGQMSAPVSPQQTVTAQQAAPGPVDAVWQAAIQQESGGRPGVLGPQTQYGQAQGLTQMLPATAQEMARKLGLPWRPDLMTATTPEAAQYQEKLGRAYFDEGLAKYGGDPEKALMYYHGGPNEKLWGPKTQRHAQAVMSRVGQPAPQGPASQGRSIQEQAMSGVIQVGEKPSQGYRATPEGGEAPIPGGPGDKTYERAADLRKEAADVRKEFNGLPLVKEFNTVRGSLKKIQTLATSVPDGAPGRAQADMALIFSFMKALDPDSVVREAEYANAQNAAGVPERVRNLYNAALTGQKLSSEQRAGMVRSAQDVYYETATTYNETAKQYHQYFKDLGIKNPGTYAPLAVAPFKPKPGRAAPAPPPQGGRSAIRVISRTKRGS